MGAWFSVFCVVTVAACVLAAPGTASRAASSSPVVCPNAERTLLHRLSVVLANLDVGLDFTRYKGLVVDARAAYNLAPASSESIDCLRYVAVPNEKALNDYLRALTSWSSCIAKLNLTCSTEGSVAYNFRQRQWSDASAQIQAPRAR